MLQPATISAPSSASSSPVPHRQQHNNRKSGISIALQSQTQSQAPSHVQSQVQANTTPSKRRNPAQTHARHQSMPAQQRPQGSPNLAHNTLNSNTGNNNRRGGKRFSASVVAPTPAQPSAQAQILQNSSLENVQATLAKQLNNHNNNTKNNNGSSNSIEPRTHIPNQRQKHQNQHSHGGNHTNNNHHNNNNNASSKAKRVQRRKDIAATTESLAKVEQDIALNQSPPLNPSSPPSSSTDSDDSESAAAQLSKPNTPRVQNRGQTRSNPSQSQSQNQFRASKHSGPLASSPPQRPNSAPVIPQPRKGAQVRQSNQGRNNNNSNIHDNTNNNNNKAGSIGRKPSLGSAGGIPVDVLRPNVTKASSADKIMLADRVTAEKNRLYAGPTFHNSPAPASLPIPAFTRSLGGSPVETSVETIPSPFFAEAASPQLNNSVRQRTQSETTGWTAHHSMPGMPFQRSHMGLNYQLSEHMGTMTYSISEHPYQSCADELTEISQNLRNLLKIQGQ
ncbi:hypothetical protein BGZ94_003725 [Podila epigama]|nr:hypothetical protein BGZ94_003725 [Podila epigama]